MLLIFSFFHHEEVERHPSEDDVIDGSEGRTIHVDVVGKAFDKF